MVPAFITTKPRRLVQKWAIRPVIGKFSSTCHFSSFNLVCDIISQIPLVEPAAPVQALHSRFQGNVRLWDNNSKLILHVSNMQRLPHPNHYIGWIPGLLSIVSIAGIRIV
jgi:hypothetical protein